MNYPITKLNNGFSVLAQMHHGRVWAVTYANRTQAYKKQAELGTDWSVRQFMGRPFYVVYDKELPV